MIPFIVYVNFHSFKHSFIHFDMFTERSTNLFFQAALMIHVFLILYFFSRNRVENVGATKGGKNGELGVVLDVQWLVLCVTLT